MKGGSPASRHGGELSPARCQDANIRVLYGEGAKRLCIVERGRRSYEKKVVQRKRSGPGVENEGGPPRGLGFGPLERWYA
jgi:hypothetical protein